MAKANAAIFYNLQNFSTSGPKLMGLQSANEGFIKGLFRYGEFDTAYCYADGAQIVEQFAQLQKAYRAKNKQVPVKQVMRSSAQQLAEVGCMYMASPSFGSYIWQRRSFNQRAYSICGLTHTISSENAMGFLGHLVTDPTQPWDALICTSTAVRKSVDHLTECYAEYMNARFGGTQKFTLPLQLPVIPLGVHVEDFHTGEKKAELRAQWRKKLNIADDEIMVLFVGRLSFHAKAHPHPMYQALEMAAQRTGKKIRLIQAGWTANEHIDAAFNEGAQLLCPSVKMELIDGRDVDTKTNIWYAADIFCSLSDNIQETFGLTPVEAMAAGLPQVVTDWDGYKDTVQKDVQGFRVSTLQPPAPAGEDLALRFALEKDNYDIYIGQACLSVSVDIAETADAFTQLISSPELRNTMGAAGRARAEQVYDWRHVIAQYQELWAELAAIRANAAKQELVKRVQGRPGNPLYDDPFALFANYPTQILNDKDVIIPIVDDLFAAAKQARAQKASNYGMFPHDDVLRQYVDAIVQHAGKPLSEVIAPIPMGGVRAMFLRTLVWFSKVGLVAIGSHNAGLLKENNKNNNSNAA